MDKIGFAVVIDPSLATTVNASRKAWIQMKSWNRTIWYNQGDVIATKLSEWIRDEANRWRSSFRWISPGNNCLGISSLFQIQAEKNQLMYFKRWGGGRNREL